MTHWLEFGGIRKTRDVELQQINMINNYLSENKESKVTGYVKNSGDVMARVIKLECAESYNELNLDVNSGFDISLKRLSKKPNNICENSYITKLFIKRDVNE